MSDWVLQEIPTAESGIISYDKDTRRVTSEGDEQHPFEPRALVKRGSNLNLSTRFEKTGSSRGTSVNGEASLNSSLPPSSLPTHKFVKVPSGRGRIFVSNDQLPPQLSPFDQPGSVAFSACRVSGGKGRILGMVLEDEAPSNANEQRPETILE